MLTEHILQCHKSTAAIGGFNSCLLCYKFPMYDACMNDKNEKNRKSMPLSLSMVQFLHTKCLVFISHNTLQKNGDITYVVYL